MESAISQVRNSDADEAFSLIHRGCRMSVLNACVSRRGWDISVVAIQQKVLGEPESVQRTLAEADWVRLKKLVEEADFWALPEHQFDGRVGLDGWTWIIEGRVGGRYHSSECWAPNTGAFFNLGNMIVEFGGLPLPDDVP